MNTAKEKETIMPMTQKQRVANALHRAPDGICARWFVHEMYPSIDRVAARINELRDNGMDIRTERCDLYHHDNASRHVKYRLAIGGLF